jgi:hypothetical protein
VCAYEQEVTRSHLTRVIISFSRHHWTWDITTDSPLTRLAMAPAATKVSYFKRTVDRSVHLHYYSGLVNAKGQCSGVDAIHRRFPEAGNSVLKRLLLGAIASEAARLLTSFSS